MGEPILCRQNLAAMPFFLENTSVNIYSLEELVYVMQQHVYLFGSDIRKTEFADWVEAELGKEELAEELRSLLLQEAKAAEFAGAVLKHTGYCNTQEREGLVQKLSEYEKKSEFECEIMKADSFLENEKYLSSIKEYQYLLKKKAGTEKNDVLLGKIWHNMGTAYARLFLFEEAAECYKKAFSYNGSPISEQAFRDAGFCVKGAAAQEISDAAFLDEWDAAQKAKQAGDMEKYYYIAGKKVNEWKKEYIKYSRV